MAASPVQGDWKPALVSPREGTPSSPESSLTWCLAHLSKPNSGAEHQGHGRSDSDGGKDMDKRSRVSQWRALVAIRTQHIKGDKAGIARFRTKGGLKPLLGLLKDPECSRKTLDVALSILANCCTELETRSEVCKLDGINIVVEILKRNVALVTVQNRAARALGNLAMDSESSALIHSAGGVPLLLLCVSLSSAPSSPTPAPPKDPCPKLECAQSAARALLYLSDTPSNRLSLLTQGTLSALAPLIAPEYPQGLRRAALRTLHELTRGCGVECAREVTCSGVLAQLGVMVTEESNQPYEELALKTLANLCSQGSLRPLVGSLGVIKKFTEEVKRDPLKSGVFFKALCLCCKEAVNRAKVKESGGLEVLVSFLAAHQSHPLSRLAIMACVDFVFDESAMEQLQELGLVPLLVARLMELSRGEEQSAEKTDINLSSSMSPTELLPSSCFDSFDFPPPEGYKREEASREQGSSSFLSLRSWLMSEGLISSEGDLLDLPSVDSEWGSLQTSTSSPQTSSPNPDCLSSLKNSSSSNTNASTITKMSSSPNPYASSVAKNSTSPNPNASSSTKNSCSPNPYASSFLKISSSPNPNASSVPKNLSSPSPSAPSFSKKVSSSARLMPNTLKIPNSAPSSPQPSNLPSSSTISSPTKTPQTPVSPSKFSSPQKRKQRAQSASSLTKFNLDTPPSVSRSVAYHHPYHPEPWTPESPILLLLSRFSHATDPSAALVNSGVMSGLLFYLTQHQDPSGRCLRMLCRLSCNPSCLQALVRTGSVALIHHHLCQREGETDRVKAKVKQLGINLLNNLRVQCESGFGSGVLAHVMLSGSELDKMNCALSLPLISSNKSVLKKLLLDSGGLLSALHPIGCHDDNYDEEHPDDCNWLPSDWFNSPNSKMTSQNHSLYFSLLVGCLSTLTNGTKLELYKKHCSQVTEPDKASPPPSKKPRLTDICLYGGSDFDLLLQLDDGTQVSANREAVMGTEGRGGVGSEYFRALLGGGFGEAQINAEDPICIRDVSVGMLLPVLHYLHGCRLTRETAEEDEKQRRGRCQMLEKLVLEGLGISQKVTNDQSAEHFAFQKTSLGEMMIGACRFLVAELQSELEDLCVSLLLPCSTRAEGNTKETSLKPDQECSESAEEKLASQTSEMELTENSVGQMKTPDSSLQQTESCKASLSGVNTTIKSSTPVYKSSLCSSIHDKSLDQEELASGPKDTSTSEVLAALLPHLYWFSQRYSYPAVGRACLSLLLGCMDCPPAFSSSLLAADCLRRLAREADCVETLKQDLLSLATVALS